MEQIMTVNEAEVARSKIAWGAIFSGLFVSIITYICLMGLGLALGTGTLRDVVRDPSNLADLGKGTMLWSIMSTLVALFVGGHMSGRVAGLVSTRVGRIQGLVIAGVFFALMFAQIGILAGVIGGGLTSVVSSAGSAMSSMANSSMAQEMVEDALGDLTVVGTPADVFKGLASRVIRGDTESATSFLAASTGISREDAGARINVLKTQFTEASNRAANAAAVGLRYAGWSIFWATLLGALAGMVGGGLGANLNIREPVSNLDARALRATHA